jgi:hypothetical protein
MGLFDLLKEKPDKPSYDLTTISRNDGVEGYSIPGLIDNLHYHFVDLQVYKDGLIYCWEMVDLALFMEKLNKGWVVTSIPDEQEISIFSLGRYKIDNGEWLHTKDSLYTYIYKLIRSINPNMEKLHDYGGSNKEKKGNVTTYKHGDPQPKPYYLPKDHSSFSDRIEGESLFIFYRFTNDQIYLSELSIYKDGRIEFTHLPEKQVYEFSELRSLIDRKVVISEVADGEWVHILGFGSFTVSEGKSVDIEYKYKEFLDIYRQLQGEEGSIRKCYRIYTEYMAHPTLKLREALKEAYEAVPDHQRMFVGDMDTKDFVVRAIIYGEAEKKRWEEHYGVEFPIKDIPKPIDE